MAPPKIRLDALASLNFDYIVVGGGTAGCLIASRLAASAPSSSILLIEAGRDYVYDADDDERDIRSVPGKYLEVLESKEGNWGYVTAPQHELGGRRIVYHRGRGLGGSSAINFMDWVRGPKADWDHWAELVGDPSWAWDNVLGLMKELEDFDPSVPAGCEKYTACEPSMHGQGGPIGVSFGTSWIPGIDTFLTACSEAGIPLHSDHNDGHPIGASVSQFSIAKNSRVSSASAFLSKAFRDAAKNLTILTETSCTRIVMEGKKAVGVGLLAGQGDDGYSKEMVVNGGKEIILTAGTFGSVQLLLLSGIGPQSELDKHGIPLVADIPGVGQNLRDHSALSVEYLQDPSILGQNQIFRDAALLSAAEDEYWHSKTGPLATFGASAALAFPRLGAAVFESAEFHRLSKDEQEFLREPSRPTTEIVCASGPLYYSGPLDARDSVAAHEGLMQNCLSRGSVTLASRDPRDPPVIDPRYLAHPYDLRVAVETVRKVVEVGRAQAYASTLVRMIHGPRKASGEEIELGGGDDEAIERFVRENLLQGYHAMGTCRMGAPEDQERVVGQDFCVVGGVQNLRIADLSVCPVLTTNHTQINVYVIAEKCVRAILKDRESENRRL